MLNLIYDATLICNYFHKDAARSGIFVVAYNILLELQKRKDVRLALYIAPEKSGEAYQIRKDLFPNARYVYNPLECFLLASFNAWLWRTHTKLFRHVWLRKPFALGIVITEFLLKKMMKKRFDAELLKCANVYLSPAFSIPELIRKKSNAKTYVLLHDTIPFKFREYNDLHWGDYIRKIFESSRKGDSFFVNSKSSLQDFEEIFPLVNEHTTNVTYLAASDSFGSRHEILTRKRMADKYKIPEDRKYVFSLCTLEPRKNLVRAVRCFMSFITKNGVNDLVWVMGGGHWESFINELKKNGVAWDPKYIIQAGYIDDEDLPILYSNAEWFVYTSQYEGFGLPPLEAMQCGCPVITSNNSSLPEVVGDAGIMIDWDSDEQHIEAYEKYYFNEELRKENSHKGLERAKLFSWEKTVDNMIKVMKFRF